MMLQKRIFFITCLVLFLGSLQAQVKFKLTQLADGKTYQVSLISNQTFKNPLNVTSTAQVTIKALNNSFEVDQIFNLQPDVVWEPNSLTEKPEEAPEYDYISFGLISQGTKNIQYEAGVEVPLFAFTNFLDCGGEGALSLMDNKNDPFASPNSKLVNVGNQITILGAQGDAYAGNAEENSVTCGANLTNVENLDRNLLHLSLFPNPVKETLAVSFDWNRSSEEVELTVFGLNGKVVATQKVSIHSGKNQANLDLRHLAQGNYFVQINGADWKIISDQFVKMD